MSTNMVEVYRWANARWPKQTRSENTAFLIGRVALHSRTEENSR